MAAEGLDADMRASREVGIGEEAGWGRGEGEVVDGASRRFAGGFPGTELTAVGAIRRGAVGLGHAWSLLTCTNDGAA